MDDRTKSLVIESWAKLVPISEQAAELFYGRLFELDPNLRFLFRAPIPAQGRLLMKALDGAVAGLSELESLVPVLRDLGKRHAPYGVEEADYDTVGAAFLWTLERGLGDAWSDEVSSAWAEVYGVMAGVMKAAQAEVDLEGPVSPRERRLVQGSWRAVVPIADQAAEIFYAKLFELDPALKPLFQADMKEQGAKLMSMLTTLVKGLDRIDEFVPAIRSLGKRHASYGVVEKDYDTVAQALLFTLGQGLGASFTDQVRAAWLKVYTLLAYTMKNAAASQANVHVSETIAVRSTRPRSAPSEVGGMFATGILACVLVVMALL